ncbi:hypothetical protein F5Y07DRAFT_400246 [Xylaria sp. FL0933]|nr:hypothetical protein F5Y07DRAFT_400246 [Xylaria sp. FL0933]
MAVPSHRMSFASFEDDDPFFSAYSSHPTSRLMSTSGITPQRWGQEEEQLPEGVNSVALHSEPLASVCQPRVGVDVSDKGAFTANSNADKPLSSSAPVTAARRSSSASARDEGLDAQGRSPPAPGTQFHGHVDKQGIDGISCNVRAFLATRRKRAGQGKPVANENETPLSSIQATPYKPHLQLPTEPDEQYLITTDDITGIIDLVIAGVRSIQDDAIQLDCRSRLLPSTTHTRPTLCARNIIPGVSAVADPTTTICSPQPCFSLANDSEKFRRLSSTPKTTYNETDNYESVERRDMVADLYHNGVDAHTCSYDPLPILEEDPQSIPIPPPQVPIEDYQSHNHEYVNEWPSQAYEGGDDYNKRLGRSIGASCHKRIRARNSLTQHQDITDNYSDCLRRHSFVPLSEHTPGYIRSNIVAEPPWSERLQEGDRGQKRSSRELLQQILDRSNSPSINAAGSYSGSRTPNMAGSQDSKLQSELEGSSCSEDGEPHICVDEQETGGSSLQN